MGESTMENLKSKSIVDQEVSEKLNTVDVDNAKNKTEVEFSGTNKAIEETKQLKNDFERIFSNLRLDSFLLPKKIDRKQDTLNSYLQEAEKIKKDNALKKKREVRTLESINKPTIPDLINRSEEEKTSLILEIYKDDLIDSTEALLRKFNNDTGQKYGGKTEKAIAAMRIIFYNGTESKEIYETLDYLKSGYIDSMKDINTSSLGNVDARNKTRKWNEISGFIFSMSELYSVWNMNTGLTGGNMVDKTEKYGASVAKETFPGNYMFTNPYEDILNQARDLPLTQEKSIIYYGTNNKKYNSGSDYHTRNNRTWEIRSGGRTEEQDTKDTIISLKDYNIYAYYTVKEGDKQTTDTVKAYLSSDWGKYQGNYSIVNLHRNLELNYDKYKGETIYLSPSMKIYKDKLSKKFPDIIFADAEKGETTYIIATKEIKTETIEANYREEYFAGQKQDGIGTKTNEMPNVIKNLKESGVQDIEVVITGSASAIPTKNGKSTNKELAEARVVDMKKQLVGLPSDIKISTKELYPDKEIKNGPDFPPTKKEFDAVFYPGSQGLQILKNNGFINFESSLEGKTPSEIANSDYFGILEEYMYRKYQYSEVTIKYTKTLQKGGSNEILGPVSSSNSNETYQKDYGLMLFKVDVPEIKGSTDKSSKVKENYNDAELNRKDKKPNINSDKIY